MQWLYSEGGHIAKDLEIQVLMLLTEIYTSAFIGDIPHGVGPWDRTPSKTKIIVCKYHR